MKPAKTNNNPYFKSAIIDFSNALKFTVADFKRLKELIRRVSKKFENNFFVIVPNIKFKVFPLTTSICDFTDELSLLLIDELIWVSPSDFSSSLLKSILWYSKKSDYQFNKDLLRVKHIWKDFEWGKRKKNYHPLGKDMGNVWIKEFSERATITKHDFFSLEEVLIKLLLSQTTSSDEIFLVYTSEKLIQSENISLGIYEKTGFSPIIQLSAL